MVAAARSTVNVKASNLANKDDSRWASGVRISESAVT